MEFRKRRKGSPDTPLYPGEWFITRAWQLVVSPVKRAPLLPRQSLFPADLENNVNSYALIEVWQNMHALRNTEPLIKAMLSDERKHQQSKVVISMHRL